MSRPDLEELVARGCALVPIPAGEKGPRIAGWQKSPFGSDDFGPGDNIGVKNGEPSGWLVDVDLDAAEAIRCADDLLLRTGLVHGRPSKPSSHHWFIATGCPSLTRKGLDNKMIVELRSTGGQTVVPPSVHPSGERIEWERNRSPAAVDQAALAHSVNLVAIAALLARHWPAGSRHDAAGAMAGFLSRAGLSPDDVERVVWSAAKAAGDEEAEDRRRIARDTAAKMVGPDSPPTTGGPALARAVGTDGPLVLAAILKWLGKEDQSALDEAVERYNRHHFVIRVGKNNRKTVVGHDAEFPPSFESFRSFEDFNRNDRVTIAKRPVVLAKHWLDHANRRTYKGELVFAPPPVVAGPDDYNLWRGFAVEPAADASGAGCDLYLDFVRTVVCGGNEEHTEFLLDVMAAKVQHPGKLTGVVVVLQGGQGVGKGTFVQEYASLFGHHFAHLDKPEHAVGKFNAALSAKLLVFMDEAFWAGDKASINAMKRLATEPTLMIERKGIDAAEEPNLTQLFLATNERWAWPAEFDDRRGFVLSVSAARARDTVYFGALRRQMSEGGRAALLAYLLARPLTKDLRLVPKTSAFGDQQDLSADALQRWWKDKLTRGHTWPEGDTWDPWICSEDAHAEYGESLRRWERGLDLDAFIKSWKTLLPPTSRFRVRRIIRSRRKPWDRSDEAAAVKRSGTVVPDLDECRAWFDRVTGVARDWPRDQDEEGPEVPF